MPNHCRQHVCCLITLMSSKALSRSVLRSALFGHPWQSDVNSAVSEHVVAVIPVAWFSVASEQIHYRRTNVKYVKPARKLLKRLFEMHMGSYRSVPKKSTKPGSLRARQVHRWLAGPVLHASSSVAPYAQRNDQAASVPLPQLTHVQGHVKGVRVARDSTYATLWSTKARSAPLQFCNRV